MNDDDHNQDHESNAAPRPEVPGKVAKNVPPEVAEQEFERFCEAMDLETDLETMGDEEDIKAYKRERATVIRAVCAGRLEFDDATAEPVFYPSKGEPLRFREPTGASFQAMEGKKRNAHVTQLYATMADITGQTTKTFSLMPNRDLKVCRALTLLFMG